MKEKSPLESGGERSVKRPDQLRFGHAKSCQDCHAKTVTPLAEVSPVAARRDIAPNTSSCHRATAEPKRLPFHLRAMACVEDVQCSASLPSCTRKKSNVEYRLTPLGRSLNSVLDPLREWAEANMSRVHKARGKRSAADGK